MDPLRHFVRLFDYDHWANGAMVAALKAAPGASEQSLQRMAHVLGAQFTWLSRLKPEQPASPVWPEWKLDECPARIDELGGLWQEYLGGMTPESLAGVMSYRNMQGEPFTNTVEDILTHVLMHSAYHRGQVAADLRASGCVPAVTDFIHAVRQGVVG